MKPTVVLVCALDTKGREGAFVKELLLEAGVHVLTLNIGILGEPVFEPEVGNDELARLGGSGLEELIARNERGAAVEVMMRGAAAKVKELHQLGQVGGIIGLGGSAGTSVGTAAMRALPLGVPKVMVTTLASGNTRPYVGMHDIMLVHSVVDISGLNRILRPILANAAFALAGAVKGRPNSRPVEKEDKPLIAASMFGVTTPCVETARAFLERHGYEVVVFHGTGIGGATMESLIAGGFFAGVLDITTSELADDVAGGLLSAGEKRLTRAGLHHVPQVVSVGAVDMANFGPPDTVPPVLRSRQLLRHNPNVTLMRTNIEENLAVGHLIADKLSLSPGRTAVFLPTRGVSSLDAEGQPFYGPEENAALIRAVRERLDPGIGLYVMDAHINDEAFALAMAEKLLELMEG